MNQLKYNKLPYGANEYSIELEDHKFSDVRFVFGKVSLNEDNFTLKYNYDIIEGSVEEQNKKEFEHTLGDLLMQMMEEGIRKNNLIYTGGTDED
jgi:hypothetical protein